MAKKISKIDKAIQIIHDNYCMINSLLAPDELKVFNGDFAGYIQRAVEARKFQLQVSRNEQPVKPCVGCTYFDRCGSTTRTEQCDGRMTKRDKDKETINNGRHDDVSRNN